MVGLFPYTGAEWNNMLTEFPYVEIAVNQGKRNSTQNDILDKTPSNYISRLYYELIAIF